MEYSPIEEVALTQKLVQIKSCNPGAFEYEISDYIEQWLRETGAEVIRQPVVSGRCNIIGRLRGKVAHPALVYICHMDTVPAGDGWHHERHGAEIIDGKVYGRGACDMKSGVAAAMVAFGKMAQMQEERKRDFLFIASVDEEDVMLGADQAVKDGYITGEDYVLDAEPTNGIIQVAHKGKTWFRLKTTGLAVHASTPEQGSDAVAAMAEIICAINRKLAQTPAHEEMGRSAATFGTIQGGLNFNIVPDSCTCTIDMRLVPPVTNAASIELVEDAIKEGCGRVPGTSCEYTVVAQRPSIEKDDQSYLLKALKEATEQVTGEVAPVSFFPGYTDSGVVAALTGNHNCMSYGPGSLALAHKADEYVPVEDIIRCTDVLTVLAKSILF